MPTTPEALRLEDQLRREFAQIVDAQTRDLVRAWAIAWDEVAPDLRDTLTQLLTDTEDARLTRTVLLRSKRLAKALSAIADELDRLSAVAGVRITRDLRAIVDQAGQAQARIISSMLPVDQDLVDLDAWSQVNKRQIDAMVRRSTQQITSLRRPLSRTAYAAVQRELIRGIAVGSNPRATASRIVARAERGFNGGLSRALVISRTETIDAHRVAAAAGQKQHADVLAGWVWLASLSSRTCPACLSMHGTVHPLSEPGPLGHQQCRCARMPQTRPWSELGFDVDEPEDLTPDADEFFERLTPADQKKILGQDGYQAWSSGDFPRSAWATRRETAGWRDSYVPATPPASARNIGSGGRGPGGPTGIAAQPPEGGFNLGDSLRTHLVGDNTRAVVDEVRAVIARVHGVGRQLPNLPVTEFSQRPGAAGQLLGAYRFELGPRGTLRPTDRYGRAVSMSVNLLDQNKTATLIHELGHFLDHKGLGGDDLHFASATDPSFDAWRAAVDTSDARSILDEMATWNPAVDGDWSTFENTVTGETTTWNPNTTHVVDYLLDPREVFARAYAQWVILRGGDQALMDGLFAQSAVPIPTPWVLTGGRAPGHVQQWDPADFTSIAEALDALFASLNLLRRQP